jgi:hypothetical protein
MAAIKIPYRKTYLDMDYTDERGFLNFFRVHRRSPVPLGLAGSAFLLKGLYEFSTITKTGTA